MRISLPQSSSFLHNLSPVHQPLFPRNGLTHMSSCVLGETKSSVENIPTRFTYLSIIIWFQIAAVVEHSFEMAVPASISRQISTLKRFFCWSIFSPQACKTRIAKSTQQLCNHVHLCGCRTSWACHCRCLHLLCFRHQVILLWLWWRWGTRTAIEGRTSRDFGARDCCCLRKVSIGSGGSGSGNGNGGSIIRGVQFWGCGHTRQSPVKCLRKACWLHYFLERTPKEESGQWLPRRTWWQQISWLPEVVVAIVMVESGGRNEMLVNNIRDLLICQFAIRWTTNSKNSFKSEKLNLFAKKDLKFQDLQNKLTAWLLWMIRPIAKNSFRVSSWC